MQSPGLPESYVRHIVRHQTGLEQHFVGVRADDEFERFPPNKSCGVIVNTQKRRERGEHYILLFQNCRNNSVVMFDPFGLSNASFRQKFGIDYDNRLRSHAARLRSYGSDSKNVSWRRNNFQFQCACSSACALYCVYVLELCVKNLNRPDSKWFDSPRLGCLHGAPHRAMFLGVDATQHDNDDRLYKYFSSTNLFVKNMKCSIVSKTIANKKLHMMAS